VCGWLALRRSLVAYLQTFRVRPLQSCVDLGSALIRSSMLRQSAARFIVDDLAQDAVMRTTAHSIRDGLFFERLVDHVPHGILNMTLFVHQ